MTNQLSYRNAKKTELIFLIIIITIMMMMMMMMMINALFNLKNRSANSK